MEQQEETQFICENCGKTAPKEIFQCLDCGKWYSFKPFKTAVLQSSKNVLYSRKSISIDKITVSEQDRIKTDMEEFDRCVGGGLVVGSVTFLSGFPGCGKSTIVLQLAKSLSNKGHIVHYATGEESRLQVKLRAERIDAVNPNILLIADQNLKNVFQEVEKYNSKFLIIDSLQKMYAGKYGTVSQLKEATDQIVDFAKKKDITIITIGHITKEGEIAGPEYVQHAVDTVLILQGEKASSYRVLKVYKNRFGSEIETGMFQMKEEGLVGISNPSNMFLTDRGEGICGSVLTPTMEGNRCVMAEIQAHVSDVGGNKITCLGVDKERVSLIISILQKMGMLERLGEIFVSTTGGIKIEEASADLAIAMAILSSAEGKPVSFETVVFGEIGLSGDVRGVSFIEHRISESEKLGFNRIVLPQVNSLNSNSKCQLAGIRKLSNCVDFLEKENERE